MSINNPKRIYLDQNKLIDLAKAFNNRDGGEIFQETLELVLKNIEEGKVIVPLSCLHVVETAKVTDTGRKERLSKFLHSITRNYSILPLYSIRGYEILNSILDKEELQIGRININRNIVEQKGIPFAFGTNLTFPDNFKAVENGIMNKLFDEESFLYLMNIMIPKDISKDMTSEDEAMVSFFETKKAKIQSISKEEAFNFVIIDLFSDSLIRELISQLNNLGINSKEFTDKYLSDRESIVGFFNSISSIEVFAKMLLARDRATKVHRNDVYDIGFLSTAVPYCDIVITENSWCHHLKQEQLDSKYNTIVLNDVNDLKKYL
ncbi:MAG: hypothetical protein WC139_05480 [Candidatus Kapaibacterium sp.]